MPLIGYARVSTSHQNLSLQRDALERQGCQFVFDDQVAGARTDRPGLAEALSYLSASDTLVVSNLDQLGRSMSHLAEKAGELATRGIGFRSLTENIDTQGGNAGVQHLRLPRAVRAQSYPRAHPGGPARRA